MEFKKPRDPKLAFHLDSDDGEESFVVMGRCTVDDKAISLISINDGLLAFDSSHYQESRDIPNVEIAQKESSFASVVHEGVIGPDSSLEDVERRVRELIEENIKLRNTIAETTRSMKNQHEQMMAWKEAIMTKVCAMNKISKVTKEEHLKESGDIDNYKQIKQLQDEEIINLRNQLKDKSKDLQFTRVRIKDLEVVLSDVKSQNADLIAQSQQLFDKLTSLEEQQARHQNENQKSEIEVKMSDSSEAINWSLKEQSMLQEIATLMARVQQQEVELTNCQTDHTSKLQSWSNEKDLMEEENEALKTKSQNQKSDIKHLKRELKKANALHNELLNQKQLEIEQLQDSLEQRVSTFQQEIIILKQQISSTNEFEEQNCTLKQQLLSSQQVITQLQAAQNVLKAEIQEVKEQIALKNDDILSLQEQVQGYKKDLEVERESHNSLIKSETEQLSNDLENLNRTNEQLQKELKAKSPDEQTYECPKCPLMFGTYQACETHFLKQCLMENN